MSSSAVEPEAPDLVCQLDNVQGMVDASPPSDGNASRTQSWNCQNTASFSLWRKPVVFRPKSIFSASFSFVTSTARKGGPGLV
ncbi:hypothetical protein SLA2020_441330 [Shorea laevis]